MKKIVIIMLMIISIFAFTYEINASTNMLGTISTLEVEAPEFDIAGGSMSCSQLMGSNLLLVIKFSINAIRIIGVIAATVMGMTTFFKALNKGDAGELNKALRKCVWLGMALIVVVMFPTLLKVIGKLFGFDISCL